MQGTLFLLFAASWHLVAGRDSHAAAHKQHHRDVAAMTQCQIAYNDAHDKCVNSKIGCPEQPYTCGQLIGVPGNSGPATTSAYGVVPQVAPTITTTTTWASSTSVAPVVPSSGGSTGGNGQCPVGKTDRVTPGIIPASNSECSSNSCCTKMSADENLSGGACGFCDAYYASLKAAGKTYIAIPENLWEAHPGPSNYSPLCGAPVTIRSNGNVMEAVIVDNCPGCADNPNSLNMIDVGMEGYKQLTNNADPDIFWVDWQITGPGITLESVCS